MRRGQGRQGVREDSQGEWGWFVKFAHLFVYRHTIELKLGRVRMNAWTPAAYVRHYAWTSSLIHNLSKGLMELRGSYAARTISLFLSISLQLSPSLDFFLFFKLLLCSPLFSCTRWGADRIPLKCFICRAALCNSWQSCASFGAGAGITRGRKGAGKIVAGPRPNNFSSANKYTTFQRNIHRLELLLFAIFPRASFSTLMATRWYLLSG